MNNQPIRYLQNPTIVCREEPFAEWLLFNPDTNQKRVTNELGAFVWGQCSQAQTTTEIAAAVCAEFEATLSDIEGDIHDLLDTMTAEGFLEAR